MMIEHAFQSPQVRLVSDGEYLEVVRSMIHNARQRCLCSLFIVDLTPSRDTELVVDSLLIELQAAAWFGVDTRLLIGGSRSNFEIAEMTLTAQRRAKQLRIPSRLLEAVNIRGSHLKLVVADDHVLTGSHNWSIGAFTTQTQDSVLVRSASLAEEMAGLFERQWNRKAMQGGGHANV